MTTPSYLIEPARRLPGRSCRSMPPDAADFLEFSDLCDALVLETWGNLDRATPARGRLRVLAGRRLHPAAALLRPGGRAHGRPVLGPLRSCRRTSRTRCCTWTSWTSSPAGGSARRCCGMPRSWPPPTAAPPCRASRSTRPDFDAGRPRRPEARDTGTGRRSRRRPRRPVRRAGRLPPGAGRAVQRTGRCRPPDGTLDALEREALAIARGGLRAAAAGPTAARTNMRTSWPCSCPG